MSTGPTGESDSGRSSGSSPGRTGNARVPDKLDPLFRSRRVPLDLRGLVPRFPLLVAIIRRIGGPGRGQCSLRDFRDIAGSANCRGSSEAEGLGPPFCYKCRGLRNPYI